MLQQTFGKSDLESIDIADNVKTAVTPGKKHTQVQIKYLSEMTIPEIENGRKAIGNLNLKVVK